MKSLDEIMQKVIEVKKAERGTLPPPDYNGTILPFRLASHEDDDEDEDDDEESS